MEKRERSTHKTSTYKTYLIPLTLVSSMFVSGIVSYVVSQTNKEADVTNEAVQKKVIRMEEEAIQTIEQEIPQIIAHLDAYDEDLSAVLKQVQQLKETLTPIRASVEEVQIVSSVFSMANQVISNPILAKANAQIENANMTLSEVDRILFRLEHLSTIQQNMKDTREQINTLYANYQSEKDPALLLELEQELDTDLTYQIEEIQNTTIEAHDVLEDSANLAMIINSASEQLIEMKEKSGKAIEFIQFWKADTKESDPHALDSDAIKKELDDSQKRLKDLPETLATRSREATASVNQVRSELEVLRLTDVLRQE